ncbi:MAG TPA: cytochrome b [Rhodospirillaceae bacterium]|nr:cytochrome b [Rhodospirillaceae bacterium]
MIAEGRYGAVAMALHWLTAAAVVGLIVIGWVMMDLPKGASLKFVLFQWHKSIGITVLLLTLLRLAWRLAHRPPPPPAGLTDWERRGSQAAHFALYVLLLVLPLGGWAAVSASPLNIPTILYGVVPWPHLPVPDLLSNREQLAELLEDCHGLGGNLMAWLAGLHVLAALWHHFYRKDEVLLRMTPRSIPLGRRCG